MIFKGYVLTKNKKCLEKIKNRDDFKTLEMVENLPEYAGILNEGTVLIDIDDGEQSEKLFDVVKAYKLKCRVYETTRGKHFMFKNNGNVKSNKVGCKLAIGIDADIKIGERNSYSILKYDGKDRPIIYDEGFEEMPKWLEPVDRKIPFDEMEQGDGRNNAFFTYILTLQSNGFPKNDARETIKIINKYIVEDPLDEREIETILRDEAFQKPIFFIKGKFMFDDFAKYLVSEHNIKRINGQLHMFHDGIYISGTDNIEAKMIEHISGLNRAKRMEVLQYINLIVRENTPQCDANLIAFKNGLFNIVTDELVPFTPQHVITNRIDWNYNPNAYDELCDKTLDKMACHDPQIRALLEEAVGYTFYRRNEMGKAFILTGDRSNGKSTYLAMINKLLGTQNTSALDLGELGDRFKTAELFGKLANIGDDIGDEFIVNTAVFKKLVTGDRLSVERKGEDPFDFNNYGKLLFSANNIPRMKDRTGAVLRRLIIVPFNATFKATDPDFDPFIKYKLQSQETMEYLILLGIKALKNVLMNNSFTKSDQVNKELEEYEVSNNPIVAFFQECEMEDILYQPTNDVYNKYTTFCIMNNLNAMSNIEFSRQVNRKFNFKIKDKKIDGVKYRIFVPEHE